MKHSRFYISLYIIIPFIFTGYTILAVMITFRLTKYGLEQGNDPAGTIFWFLVVISILAFASGFSLVRFMLKPVEKFVKNAKKLASFPASKTRRGKDWSVDKLEQFTSVFDQVTSVLSRIDARHFFPDIIG